MGTVEREQVAVLQDVSFRLTRRLRKHSNPDLSLSQMSALSTLQRHGPMRIGDLARREQISKSSATRLVARLESTGYLDRQPIRVMDAASTSLSPKKVTPTFWQLASVPTTTYCARWRCCPTTIAACCCPPHPS